MAFKRSQNTMATRRKFIFGFIPFSWYTWFLGLCALTLIVDILLCHYYFPNSKTGLQIMIQVVTKSESDGNKHHEHPVHGTSHFQEHQRWLTEEDQEFLRVTGKLKMRVIITDPIILFRLLPKNQKQLLHERNISISQLAEGRIQNYAKTGLPDGTTTCTSMALLRDNSEDSNIDFSNMELLHQLRVRGFFFTTYSGKFIGVEKSGNKDILHSFFEKNNHIIHVAAFFRIARYILHGAIPTNAFTHPIVTSMLRGHCHLFGKNGQGLYDGFTVVSHMEGGKAVFSVPQDIAQFLFQIPTSRFIPCDYRLARRMQEKFPDVMKPSPEMDKNVLQAIQTIKEILMERLIPFWISSGTLLGWYRQCGVIPYVEDVDVVTWATFINDPIFVDRNWLISSLNLTTIYGLPEYGYQLVFRIGRIKVDFFFMYEEDAYLWFGGHIPRQGAHFQFQYPKFSLCSAILIEEKVLVPCDPLSILIEEYGPHWKKPVQNWQFAHSPFNMAQKIYWSDNIIDKTFTQIK